MSPLKNENYFSPLRAVMPEEELCKSPLHVVKPIILPDDLDFNEPLLLHLKQFEELRITDRTDIPAPVPVITIGDGIISTEGNITTISGASKSGKSAFTGWIIAGAIVSEGQPKEGLPELVISPNIDRKAVIHIDTEQARHKQQENLRSILRRAGLEHCPNYYLSYNIRELDISSYQEKTTGICQAACESFGGIHLIVIDGIADYIRNVNDEIESNAIVKYFEELATRYNTTILAIVHTNPGSDKERGHLGSQCQRKSESVLTVKCNNGISHLEPRFLRMAGIEDIPRIQFKYDKEKGYHVGCGVLASGASESEQKKMDKLYELASKIFEPPIALGYGDAIKNLMEHTGKSKLPCKNTFTDMKANGIIIQNEQKDWQLNIEQV